MTENIRVVVIGGGYAGVIAANHLRVNADIAITLINPRARFVERIRLHQLVTGSDDAVVEYSEYRVSGQITYSHWKPFDLVLNAGYALEREFDYFRADRSYKADPAPFVRLELDAEF